MVGNEAKNIEMDRLNMSVRILSVCVVANGLILLVPRSIGSIPFCSARSACSVAQRDPKNKKKPHDQALFYHPPAGTVLQSGTGGVMCVLQHAQWCLNTPCDNDEDDDDIVEF